MTDEQPLFMAFADHCPMGVGIVGMDGCLQFANRALRLGAELVVDNRDGAGGTRVELRLPARGNGG